VHCLNALGIVKKEPKTPWRFTTGFLKQHSDLSREGLLFLYEPLKMSLYDGVTDYSCSDRIKKTPRTFK
jgi:hypothetical protein